MIETIKTLCRLSGPSGAEEPVRQYLLQQARPHADEIRQDAMGNLLVFKRGRKRPTRTILLAAHMDEVGVIVKSATDDGFLRFAFVGGVDRRVVIGKRVFLGPERVSAVVGMKPIHLASAGERKKIPPLEQLYLDLGADSRAEAERLAAPGTYGVFDDTLTELDGDMLSVKALDDRVGCGVMLSLLQQELPVDTWFAFTVCEEVGCRGAFGAAFGLRPDKYVWIANLITNPIMNILIVVLFNCFLLDYYLLLLFLEIAVATLEFWFYTIKYRQYSRKRILLFAVTANLASWGVYYLISNWWFA